MSDLQMDGNAVWSWSFGRISFIVKRHILQSTDITECNTTLIRKNLLFIRARFLPDYSYNFCAE